MVVLVVPAEAGRAVVGAAGGQPGRVEAIDGRPVRAREGDMDARVRLVAVLDEEAGLAVATESGRALTGFEEQLVPERCQHLEIELFARLVVADVEADVVDHCGF